MFGDERARFIRRGRNPRRYDPKEGEEHDASEPGAGFAWKVLERMGKITFENGKPNVGDLNGLARAMYLILPLLTANVPDIPNLVAQVAIRATGSDGKVSDYEWNIIKKSADIHGIKVERPGGFNRAVSSLFDPFRAAFGFPRALGDAVRVSVMPGNAEWNI